ncbi:MAG: hypothetical protein KC486_35130 [Myxococcales bacterium]|nr:hypothetical protein [Myxococcales bacterium]
MPRLNSTLARAGLALALLAPLALASCTKKGFLKVPEADDEVSGQVGSFTADTHFLLEPIGDPEDLLGRAVQISDSGGWTIADARAPGCEVEVVRQPAEYAKTYEVNLDDMTTLAAGYRDLLGLSARYGRSVQAEYQVQNAEILKADTRGPCGDVIVSSLRIGSGERSLVRRAAGEVKGGAGKGDIGARAGRSGKAEQIDRMEWSTPQAYAFTFKRLADQEPLDLEIAAPTSLKEGQALAIEISATQSVYLVVLFLEEDGPGGVLWPDDTLRFPKVEAGGSLTLPPAGSDPLVAALREPGVPTLETLVLFAFTEEADFDRLRPQGAVVAADYAAKLSEELVALPMSRWARTTLSYAIEPAGGAAAPVPEAAAAPAE